MKKQKVDYIKFFWSYREKDKIKIYERAVPCGFVLEVHFLNSYIISELPYEKEWKGQMKKLKRKLKKYDLSFTAAYMDSVMENVMGKKDLAFDSRKQELLRNVREIFQLLKPEEVKLRGELLIVVEDGYFSFREWKLLLLDAKDLYEDITVFSADEKVFENPAFDFLQNEWGVVINKVSKKELLKKLYNSVLLVVAKWENILGLPFSCDKAYVLCQEEYPEKDVKHGQETFVEEHRENSMEENLEAFKEGHKKCLKHYKENAIIKYSKKIACLYSGYHYCCENMPISYQMAVDLLKQNQNEKIRRTSVAIFELKC